MAPPQQALPALCSRCGLIFPSMIVVAGTVRSITLSGNRQTCPRCGWSAAIIEGRFDVIGGVIRALDKASLTELEAFAQIFERESDPERIRERITAEAPWIARYVPKNSGEIAAWVTIVVMLVNLWLASNRPQETVNVTINYNFPDEVAQIETEEPGATP